MSFDSELKFQFPYFDHKSLFQCLFRLCLQFFRAGLFLFPPAVEVDSLLLQFAAALSPIFRGKLLFMVSNNIHGQSSGYLFVIQNLRKTL